MKVLIVHNRYSRRNPSGENEAVESDVEALTEGGHRAAVLRLESDSLIEGSLAKRAYNTYGLLSDGSALGVQRALRFAPDIIHVHNPFPFLSSAGLRQLFHSAAPVVMTIHNFRLSCMAGTHYRMGSICHSCDEWGGDVPGVAHRCYRSSFLQSGAAFAKRKRMVPLLRDCAHYFALTTFHRDYLVGRSIPEGRITVRGTMVADPGPDPGPGPPNGSTDGHFLFVGRFSPEKGVELLFDAWRLLGVSAPPLKLIGSGPLQSLVDSAVEGNEKISCLGRLGQPEVIAQMRRARAIVIPSTCYEGLPRALVESLSVGLPVIATNLGGLRDVVGEAVGRSTFADAHGLARSVQEMRDLDFGEYQVMVYRARQEYRSKFSAEASMNLLMAGYEAALETKTRWSGG